jgi:hypothetical protein
MTHDLERVTLEEKPLRHPLGPRLPRPDLRQFIDAVIIPALLERLLRQRELTA